MKKILFLGTLLASTALFADNVKLQGTIAEVYDVNKTLLIDSTYGGQMAVKVLPNTKIEMDNCGIFGMDKYGKFKDLNPGDFLEIKLQYQYNPTNQGVPAVAIAREIEIECYKKAY